MQFRKWPHYLRERKPRHLRVDGISGLETPLGCMALMQTTSPQGERGVSGRSPRSSASHMRQYKWKHISLIYTPAMPNESAHVPKRCNHLGGIQVRPTLTSRRRRTPLPRKVWSGSPLLTCALIDKRKRFLILTERNWHEHPHEHYPPKPHT